MAVFPSGDLRARSASTGCLIKVFQDIRRRGRDLASEKVTESATSPAIGELLGRFPLSGLLVAPPFKRRE